MSRPGPVVADSSLFIALGRIGQLGLLQPLFGEILVPEAVVNEVFGPDAVPSWVHTAVVAPHMALAGNLGAGERETIALALQVQARLVILDDLPARRLAVSRGLPVIGTVAVLLVAKREGKVRAVRPLLEQLMDEDFRISQEVMTAALTAAGEG